MEDLTQQTPEVHKRIIIHIDMDYYYAQVEEIKDPTLKSKPLGIQQKNIVVTSNYVARDFGIKKLMTVSEAKKLCPELALVNGEDLSNYRQMSNKIFEIMHKYTSLVEKLGLDENYLDVTDAVNRRLQVDPENKYLNIEGCIYPPNESLKWCSCGCGLRLTVGTHLAKEIRDELYQTLNITCCAGIAHNKLLAKLVGSMNKPNNQTVLLPTAAESFMRSLGCLKKITGIGQKTELLLNECGVMTVVDLQNCDFEILKNKLGYESANKLRDLSYGRDSSMIRPSGKPKTIGLEDSCKPLSVRKDVEGRFRLLLMRLVNQVSEDGRIPVAIKIIIRKFDAKKKSSHRETKQANILPSLFKPLYDGHILLADGAQDKLLKIIMRLFERIVDMKKPFNITLLGLAFSKFQERKFGSSSIASFLIKKTDLEVQSVTSLKSDGAACFEPSDEFYRRRTTASPIPMLVDVESIPSDVSDFSETEIEPSPKKSRLGLLIAKRRCISTGEMSDLASPSKLRVAELRLNSRDSEKDCPNVCQSALTNHVPLASPILSEPSVSMLAHEFHTLSEENMSIRSVTNGDNAIDREITTTTTTITGNLANIPCPSGVDPNVFKELPLEVQNELISSWRNSITAKANNGHTATAGARANTLHRYFIKNN